MNDITHPHWWQEVRVYQIYPRSFQDSNGDGVGDLPGITQRLPYIQGLGIDAIWISPFYPSPMADFGYDVSNYRDVDPLFGTLDDFDALLARVHGLGLKVILDFVPCHMSDRHPWFIESRQSKDNPKRNWIFRPMPRLAAARPITGTATLVVQHGSGTSTPGNITCTRSWCSSPTSTGATLK